MADEMRKEWIRKAVDELPEVLRDTVLVVYYQEMKYREAAEILGFPVGTVKSRMHAAVLKLHEAWTSQYPDEEDILAMVA